MPEKEASLPDVVVDNVPGSVYLGGMTGPQHYVQHRRAFDGELLDLGSEGRVGVAIMVRCSLFSHCRSRGKKSTPAPISFFELLAQSFREGLMRSWRLPTLAECVPFYQSPELSEQFAQRGLKRSRSEA